MVGDLPQVRGQGAGGQALAQRDAALPEAAHGADEGEGLVGGLGHAGSRLADVGDAIARAVGRLRRRAMRDVDAKAVGRGQARPFSQCNHHGPGAHGAGDVIPKRHARLPRQDHRARAQSFGLQTSGQSPR